MFWKILQWVQYVISLIREAEDQLGFARGEEKKALVMKDAVRFLDGLATSEQLAGCAPEVLAAHVGKVIDGAVGVFNCLGIFRTSSARAAPAAAAGSPESAPPAGQG